MKLAPMMHASLTALALFAIAAGTSRAGTPEPLPAFILAQAETEAPAADFDQIRKFLAGGRDLSRLDDERLQQRLTRAKRFQRVDGLPGDIAGELEQEVAQINAEIERRQQAAAEPPAAEPEQPPAPVEQAPQPQPEPEPQQQAQPEAPPPEPETVQQTQPEPAPEAAQSQADDEVARFLQSVRPASELSRDELRRQMQQARALAETKGLPKEQRRALRDVIRDARAVLNGKGDDDAAGAGTPPAPQPQPEPQQQAQSAKVDPALERQARDILNDDTNVRELSRRELRQRLSGMRDLLASGRLSPETREALRSKLAAERQILRRDVSGNDDGEAPAQGAGGNTSVVINNNTTITNNELRIVLRDQRPPEQLDEDELVRRIDIYREIVRDERYAEAERRAWRRALERDRRYLRRQMLEERQARAERLRSGQIEFDVVIGDDYDPDADYRDDVFAAEVEDDELADVLAAPPRRRIERRYSLEEFERIPEAREAMARIEIDTVNFGFGEGFLREEEIDKLDRIAEVLEKVLARNPDEVFLLEGHTDAVGSNAANLALSRERALAVKEALTTYYVIPAENLRTVGLGERYLKIPTLQAEAENRRVSLARITPLVGELD